MFYSKAAARLAPFESAAVNRRRIRLRRIGGAMMFLLAVLTFAGLETIDPRRSPNAFVGVWAGVVVLMFVILVLALMDMRLTGNLRRRDKDGRE
jgi:peptidoglycan/LPS O-acetylase OafA/YrhL